MRGVQALPSLESGDTAAICAPELQNSLEEYEASMRAVAQVARGCVELQVRATERAGWDGRMRVDSVGFGVLPLYEICYC